MMNQDELNNPWWCSISVRICHPTLIPTVVTEQLNAIPTIACSAGDSQVPFGECRSAGYWCIEHRVNSPHSPDMCLRWVESFIHEREQQIIEMLRSGYDVNIYFAIHCRVLAVGFDLLPLPTVNSLGIPIGIEYFAS